MTFGVGGTAAEIRGYEKIPVQCAFVIPEAQGRGSQGGGRGGPVTFTAKSMTLLTATSARSSAIFPPRPLAGSAGPRSGAPPTSLSAPAHLAASPSTTTARLPAPIKNQSEGRRKGEAGPRAGGEKALVKGAWRETRGKVALPGAAVPGASPPGVPGYSLPFQIRLLPPLQIAVPVSPPRALVYASGSSRVPPRSLPAGVSHPLHIRVHPCRHTLSLRPRPLMVPLPCVHSRFVFPYSCPLLRFCIAYRSCRHVLPEPLCSPASATPCRCLLSSSYSWPCVPQKCTWSHGNKSRSFILSQADTVTGTRGIH